MFNHRQVILNEFSLVVCFKKLKYQFLNVARKKIYKRHHLTHKQLIINHL